MTINRQQVKQAAQTYFNLLENKINNATVKGGFLGLQNKDLDWDQMVTGELNFIWDATTFLNGVANDIYDRAATTDLEEAADTFRDMMDEMFETYKATVTYVDGWNDNYKTINFSEDVLAAILGQHENMMDGMQVIAETIRLVAKEMARSFGRVGYGDAVDMIDGIGNYVKEEVTDLVEAMNEEGNANRVEREVVATAKPDLTGFFK